jgi:hypothetical protein
MAKDNQINGYELSRDWFDFCFENPELIKPNHSALYFFAIEHCNRMGWKSKFGFPTEMAKEAIGIKNYRTYTNTLSDLVNWGFIKMVEKSRNQYSANIIAIVKNTIATTKALDKARSKHGRKQGRGIDSVYKQETNKPLTIELKPENFQYFSQVVSFFDSKFYKEKTWLECYDKLIRIDKFKETEILEIVRHFRSDGNWWKDNGNFQSLLKLRQKNNEQIMYIDSFKSKINNTSNNNIIDSQKKYDEWE